MVFENGLERAVKVVHHGLWSACRWVRHNRRSYAKSPTYIISATGFSSSCILWVCLSLPPLVPSSTLLFFTPSAFHPLPSPRAPPHSLFPPYAVIFFDRTLFVPTPSHTAHRHWWRDLSRSGFLSSLSFSLSPPLCLSPYFSPPVSISASLPPSSSLHTYTLQKHLSSSPWKGGFSPFFFCLIIYFPLFFSNSFTSSGCSSKTGTNMFYFQLVIMAGTVLLAYYFEYTDTFPVHIQGFFCFDKSYSKPYPGPEDNSKAPPVLVYSLVTAIPTVTVSPRSTCWKRDGGGKPPNTHIHTFRHRHGTVRTHGLHIICTWSLWTAQVESCVGVRPHGLSASICVNVFSAISMATGTIFVLCGTATEMGLVCSDSGLISRLRAIRSKLIH